MNPLKKVGNKVGNKLFYTSQHETSATPDSVVRATVKGEQISNSRYFYRNPAIEFATFRSQNLTCETGELESTSRYVTGVIDHDTSNLPSSVQRETLSNERSDLQNNISAINYSMNIRRNFVLPLTMGTTLITLIAVFTMMNTPTIAVFIIIFILTTVIMGGYEIDRYFLKNKLEIEKDKFNKKREIENEIDKSWSTSRSGLRSIEGKTVTVVPCIVNREMIKVLKDNEPRSIEIANLFKNRLDILGSVISLYWWVLDVGEILKLDKQFPIDLIPVVTKDNEKVVTELKKSKKRVDNTQKQLADHRSGVLEQYAIEDSTRNQQLAIEYIKHMEY